MKDIIDSMQLIQWNCRESFEEPAKVKVDAHFEQQARWRKDGIAG